MLDGFLEDESLFGEFLRTPVSEGGTEPPVVGPPHVVGGVVPQLLDRGVVVPAHELLPQQPVRRREQLPTHRQGAPPGHRGTARLPLPANGRPDGVFCQIFVGRFGVSFSPFERLFLGRFGFGQSCGLSVIA